MNQEIYEVTFPHAVASVPARSQAEALAAAVAVLEYIEAMR